MAHDFDLQLLDTAVWVAASLLVISTTWCLIIVATLSREFFKRRMTQWRTYLRKAFLLLLVSSVSLTVATTTLVVSHFLEQPEVIYIQRLAMYAFLLSLTLMVYYLGATLKGGEPSRLWQLRALDAEIDKFAPEEWS